MNNNLNSYFVPFTKFENDKKLYVSKLAVKAKDKREAKKITLDYLQNKKTNNNENITFKVSPKNIALVLNDTEEVVFRCEVCNHYETYVPTDLNKDTNLTIYCSCCQEDEITMESRTKKEVKDANKTHSIWTEMNEFLDSGNDYDFTPEVFTNFEDFSIDFITKEK